MGLLSLKQRKRLEVLLNYQFLETQLKKMHEKEKKAARAQKLKEKADLVDGVLSDTCDRVRRYVFANRRDREARALSLIDWLNSQEKQDAARKAKT